MKKKWKNLEKNYYKKIKTTELERKAFSAWLWKLDYKRDLVIN